MDSKKKVSRVRPKAKTIDTTDQVAQQTIDYKTQILAIVEAFENSHKAQLQSVAVKYNELNEQLSATSVSTATISSLNDRILELEAENEGTVEKYESQMVELKAAFQEQESESNNNFIQKINGLEANLIELTQRNTELSEQLELTKQLLVTFQTKQLNADESDEAEEVEEVEEVEETEEAEEVEEVEEVEEETEEVEEAEEAEEEVEEVEEEVQEEVQEVEEVPQKAEDVEEVDVSKFDIVEIDDKEYYVDLDNNIIDKDTLEVVGNITDDGDAIFNDE